MIDWNVDNLSEEIISAQLSRQKQEYSLFNENSLKKAGVLVPLYWSNRGWELFFTRRTDTVQYHKGQVSFPGGVTEQGDANIIATALRESQEEIGLSAADVRVLGTMSAMPTPTGYLITPVVGKIYPSNPFTRSQCEVERIFSIPLGWLSDSSHWEERDYTRNDGSVERVVFFQNYDGELIWGITGRIVVNFLTLLKCMK
jgi:8-oxo-dGTP pyrophosphatase MutT (NUDIX family)